MKLATIKLESSEVAAVITPSGVIPMKTLNKEFDKNWATDLFSILNFGHLEELQTWYNRGGKDALASLKDKEIPFDQVKYGPLYRQPGKIWGIGLNYAEHAGDLAEKVPTTAPGSFMKPFTTIIGHGDTIKIPVQSEKTTGEAELGVIFGKKCRNVELKNWEIVVAGYTTILDMTAEDILRLNPRYLTLAKSFDTFFSFGPHFVTSDEIENVFKLKVATVINGKIHAQNVVSNMTYPPDYLVSFHSKVMTMLPGDIISTGTPRAVEITDGDILECRIDGFESLVNPVKDLKVGKK